MRVPSATYRLQLHRGFPLDRALALVDYLRDLGITDVYCSPLLMARPGSEHGYDVTDPTRLNPELGSERDLERLATRLGDSEMGLLLDVVPNHLCLTSETNSWWQDVLGHGRDSEYAHYFDVYWEPGGPSGRPQVTLPILGEPLDAVIDGGQLRVVWEDGELSLRYFEHKLPLDPKTLPREARELSTRSDAEVRRVLDGMNSPSSLRSLIAGQAYRPVHWKRTRERVGYRRFFDINELIGIRVEDPAVFADTHARILEWVEWGWVTGLRIDHIDGLKLPKEYLDRLQAACLAALGRGGHDCPPGPFYIVVEKILARGEDLPPHWATAGTSGYEFLNATARLFVEGAGESRIRKAYVALTGISATPETIELTCRRLVLRRSLHGSVRRLAERAASLAGSCGYPGVDVDAAAQAIMEIIARFSVYRTYVGELDENLSKTDRERLTGAVEAARKEIGPSRALDCVALLLELEPPEGADRAQARDFVLRFQQLSGPAAAKGFEDTALYRYVPLVSANEVGADLTEPSSSVKEFHDFCGARQARTPYALSATSTHDTKRNEDARLRVAALSEMPERWIEAVERFRSLNREHRTRIGGEDAPDDNDEYLFYQSLLGLLAHRPEEGWGDLRDRLSQYMQKAVREAKRKSSWWDPDEAYEAAVDRFVRRTLDPHHNARFTTAFAELAEPVVRATRYSSLSQTLLKIACPGVPDFYQGTELFRTSLVDPDNRRPVDFDRRRALLADLSRRHAADPLACCEECLRDETPDRMKLLVTWRSLTLRRDHAELFAGGDYVPLPVSGRRRDHLIAFSRIHGDQAAVVVAGRFFVALTEHSRAPIGEIWGETTVTPSSHLPGGAYRNAFTGETYVLSPRTACSVDDLLRHFPVALLIHERHPGIG